MNLGIVPQKRMAHASTIFGGYLLIHGGIYAEDASLRNDI